MFVYSQTYTLKINTSDSTNLQVINTIEYLKKHKTKEQATKEIINFSTELSLKGYINNTHSMNQKDSLFECTFTLNSKIDSILIYYDSKLIDAQLIKNISADYTEHYFKVATTKIKTTLNEIINYFEYKGFSFTKATLINLKQHHLLLTANLKLQTSNKRIINNVVIKGYDAFPKKYIKHYLDLQKSSVFNLSTINSISTSLNAIPFITQLKQPEILFTKDSTLLFLYLKKKSTSTFDGIIGFSNSKNTDKLNLNGYVNLHLNNLFDKGSHFGFNWKNNGDDTQTLNIQLKNPYIFNSRFSTSGSFSILKQDSTFVTTKSVLQLKYNLNKKSSIHAIYNNENSNVISPINTASNISEFKTNFIGISFNYKEFTSNNNFNPIKYDFTLEYLRGNRITKLIKTNQNKIALHATYLITFSKHKSMILKNHSELLTGKNLLQNELFRIGGVNSLRGFDEQSIFTSKYSITNIDYQYNLNNQTLLYSISDIAIIKNENTPKNSLLYGLGLGYSTTSENSILDISYVLGINDKQGLNFKNSRIHIKITYPF
jgi:hemolysin activation/secretion protein